MVAQTTAASSPPAPWSGAGRIAGPDDVARVLAAVNAAGGRRANTAALLRPVTAVDDLAERAGGAAGHLPAHPLVAPLLPWPGGLRRGATVAVTGGASLLLALLAGAMSTGGWAGVVGLPSLGAVAAPSTECRWNGSPLRLIPARTGPRWPRHCSTDWTCWWCPRRPAPSTPRCGACSRPGRAAAARCWCPPERGWAAT
jgi:hypothetical protein